jgi:hypothetical protein
MRAFNITAFAPYLNASLGFTVSNLTTCEPSTLCYHQAGRPGPCAIGGAVHKLNPVDPQLSSA